MATQAEYALKLTCHMDEAFEMLGDLAGLYGDNGGDPDGDLWVPKSPISFDEGKPITDAGYGIWTRAFYYDDMNDVGEMLHTFGYATTVEACAEQQGILADEIENCYYDLLRDALNINCDLGKIVGWAGYGNGESIVVVW